MMRAIKAGMLAIAVLASYGITCPLDGGNMWFTGATRSEWGKLLYEYRCPAGHTTWVVQ